MTFSRFRLWMAVLLGGVLGVNACAHRTANLPKKERAPIRRLAVQTFEGDGGADVTREFVQALKTAGWTLVGRQQGPDAVLMGSVNDYASHKVMIFLGETNMLSGGKTTTVSNPVVSMGGSQVLPQGPTASVSSPHMVTEHAAVGVSARLVVLPGGTPVWGDDFTYESLDLSAARRVVVGLLTQSLSRVVH